MLCNLLYFNYMGMLIVSLTPGVQVASILTFSFYSMLNLFCGFTVTKPVSSFILLRCIKKILETLTQNLIKNKDLSAFIMRNLFIILSFFKIYQHHVIEWPTSLSLSNIQISFHY